MTLVPSSHSESLSPPPPRAAWSFAKGLRWFLAEFLVVVAGIVVALALNSWYQTALDVASEHDYLALLSRDLQGTLDDLQTQATFEQAQLKDGLVVYRALSSGRYDDTAALSLAISRLSQRKTMILKNSAYEDLVNTGNVRLIRNHGLREHIIAFYQSTGLQLDVLNKNNAFFVDQTFTEKILLSGLVLVRPGSNHPQLAASDKQFADNLRGGFIEQPDPLWDLPADAPQWSMVHSNLVMRLRISALNHFIAMDRTQAAKKLKADIDEEMGRQ